MPGSSAESISSLRSFRSVPQKAQSKLGPSRPSFILLFRVSRKRNRGQNQFQMESEMKRATVVDFGSVSSFRSGEHARSSIGSYVDLDEQLKIFWREGCCDGFEGIIGSSRSLRLV